jgi:hypothetical protein
MTTGIGDAFSRLTARIPKGTKTAVVGGAVAAGALALKAAHDIAVQVTAERLMNRSRHVGRYAGRVKDLPYQSMTARAMHPAAQPFQRLQAQPYHGLKAFAAQPKLHAGRGRPGGGGGGLEPRDDHGRWTTA